MDADVLLKDVPDLQDMKAFEQWVEVRLATLASASFDETALNSFTGVAFSHPWAFGNIAGPYASPVWRRFAAAIFLADWACYEQPADRVDFARLLYVLGCFPTGFRVWMCRLSDGQYTPVGYTGWYPIPRTVFEVVYAAPDSITHRGFMGPLRELQPGGSYLYLFNASIIPGLQRTKQSSMLMYSYISAIAKVKTLGKASVTVSEDGARVSRVLGLAHIGKMTFEGEVEQVFAVRGENDSLVSKPRPRRT